MERTLIILKPDALKKGVENDVLDIIRSNGLEIEHVKGPIALDRGRVEEHYAVHRDRPFFQNVVDYMVSGHTMPAIVKGENAVARVREIIGSTVPAEADPNSIRGMYSDDTMEQANAEGRAIQNIIHASGNIEEANAEIAIWFPEVSAALNAKRTASTGKNFIGPKQRRRDPSVCPG